MIDEGRVDAAARDFLFTPAFMSLIRDRLIGYVEGLRFPYLVALTGTLFLIDLIVPDLLPWADEILLALGTIILARLKRPGVTPPPFQPKP